MKHVRILVFTYDVPLAVTPLRMHIFAHVSSKANDWTRAHLWRKPAFTGKQYMEGAICPICVKIAYSTCWEMAIVKLEPQLYHEGKHQVSSEANIFLPIECCQIQPHSNTSSDEHPRLFFYHTSGQLQTVQQHFPCVAHRGLSGWPLSYR